MFRVPPLGVKRSPAKRGDRTAEAVTLNKEYKKMNKQISRTILILILVVGANVGLAQNKLGEDFSAATVYTGLETSAGTLDPVSGLRYGNTFVLSSTGEYDSRHLTVSINSQEMFVGVGVTGGAWSLTVIRDGVYLGTVYGEVMSGDIENIVDEKGEIIGKRTRIELQATGGTSNLDTDETRKLTGSFDMKTDSATLETTAIAKFNF